IVTAWIAGIVLFILWYAIPGRKSKNKIVFLKHGVEHDAIPAARQLTALPVGLVIDYAFIQHVTETKDFPVIGETQNQFRLMIGIAEGCRDITVVHLPERLVGITQEQVAVVIENSFAQQDLDAQLKFSFGVPQILDRKSVV